MRTVVVLVAFAACRYSASSHGADSAIVDDSPVAIDGSDASDRVVSSFVFVGCNRIQKSDLDPVNDPSSANVAELQQDFADIAALPDAPAYWFFVGDLVMNLEKGAQPLQSQLDAWAQLYAASPVASTLALVPVVGNHEMLYKNKNGDEISNPAANGVWTAWLAANRFDGRAGNGPTNAVPNADALQDDQSKLTYSFDDDGAHYVVLDTDSWTTTPDPSTGDTQIGWVALDWLAADLAAAQANAATTAIFVFGHKPVIAPASSDDGTMNAALSPQVAQLFDATPKVKGYFAAHVHEWFTTQLPGQRGVWQIVAGNGGSQLDSHWTEPEPYYGFTVVKRYASGKVGVVSYRRPVPSPYDAATATPATPSDELTIAP